MLEMFPSEPPIRIPHKTSSFRILRSWTHIKSLKLSSSSSTYNTIGVFSYSNSWPRVLYKVVLNTKQAVLKKLYCDEQFLRAKRITNIFLI